LAIAASPAFLSGANLEWLAEEVVVRPYYAATAGAAAGFTWSR
jgi:hypothetical protein